MSQSRLPQRLGLLALLSCAGGIIACATSREPEAAAPEPAESTATVEVDNRGFADMTIYVIDGSRRVRLGLANGNSVTKLTIPPYLIQAGLPMRFLCDPVGSSRTPVSDEIMVNPGDTVLLEIPAG